jgi:hypothetical protein
MSCQLYTDTEEREKMIERRREKVNGQKEFYDKGGEKPGDKNRVGSWARRRGREECGPGIQRGPTLLLGYTGIPKKKFSASKYVLYIKKESLRAKSRRRRHRIRHPPLSQYTVGKARVSVLLPRIFPCYFMNIIHITNISESY